MFNKSEKKNTSKLRLTKSAEQKADKKLNSPQEPSKAAELNQQSSRATSTGDNELTGSQGNVRWCISDHVIEFFGSGEFCPKDILYDSDVQFADFMRPGPAVIDIDDYCAPWCWDSTKHQENLTLDIRTIIFHPGFTAIKYDFDDRSVHLDGFCGGRETCCSEVHDVYIPFSVTDIESYAFGPGRSNLVIHAPAGSYADQFARENGFQFESTM